MPNAPLSYAHAAQTEFTLHGDAPLPVYCAHGTVYGAYKAPRDGAQSTVPGGPAQNRAEVHVAIRQSGGAGRFVPGFRPESQIHM